MISLIIGSSNSSSPLLVGYLMKRSTLRRRSRSNVDFCYSCW